MAVRQGKISDGKSDDFVAPVGGVEKGNFYRNNGINHIAMDSVLATETYAGDIDSEAFFRIPIGAVVAARGAVLYIPAGGATAADITATKTGNVPALFCMEAKDGNNNVVARLLNIPIVQS